LSNLNADESDKTQDSLEDCMAYCSDTYAEARFFTYYESQKKCYCKECHDLNITRRDASGRISGNLNCETLEPCYTEEDIQYKIENIEGLNNLNKADGNKKKDSMEECRTYCRDSYPEAAYFTYNRGNTKCYCKEDHDLEQTRQEKGGRVSGNVKCVESSAYLYPF